MTGGGGDLNEMVTEVEAISIVRAKVMADGIENWKHRESNSNNKCSR